MKTFGHVFGQQWYKENHFGRVNVGDPKKQRTLLGLLDPESKTYSLIPPQNVDHLVDKVCNLSCKLFLQTGP